MNKRRGERQPTPEEAKFEQRVEEEVRRRVAALLSQAGLPESDVAKEVLYWLPQEFVEYYRDLFLQALQLQGRGREGYTRLNTRGERVTVGDNRRVGVGTVRQRRRESDQQYAERTRGIVAAGGAQASKRFKNVYTIRDDEAFKTKTLVDRRLIELTQGIGLKARQTQRSKTADRKRRSNGDG